MAGRKIKKVVEEVTQLERRRSPRLARVVSTTLNAAHRSLSSSPKRPPLKESPEKTLATFARKRTSRKLEEAEDGSKRIVTTSSTETKSVTTTKRQRAGSKTEQKNSKASETTEVELSSTSISKLMRKEYDYWRKGHKFVVGVDEAGRGPLAGPVVVAGCAIDEDCKDVDSTLIDDSKAMDEEAREKAYEIDEKNILRATLAGMDRVVSALAQQNKCDIVLIDGPFKPPEVATKYGAERSEAIKGGDGIVRAIGAASILAKVTRDRLMKEYHVKYPQYGFDKHKGYPVPAHVAALMSHGPCEIHRNSYAPVKKAILAIEAKKNTK